MLLRDHYDFHRTDAVIDIDAYVIGIAMQSPNVGATGSADHSYLPAGSKRIFCTPFSSAYSRLSSQMYSSSW